MTHRLHLLSQEMAFRLFLALSREIEDLLRRAQRHAEELGKQEKSSAAGKTTPPSFGQSATTKPRGSVARVKSYGSIRRITH
jgi:hypothetical protein